MIMFRKFLKLSNSINYLVRKIPPNKNSNIVPNFYTPVFRSITATVEMSFPEKPESKSSPPQNSVPPQRLPQHQKPSDLQSTAKQISEQNINSEELLEKFIAGLSRDIHQKNRVYKNDFMRVLDKVRELNFSSKKQGLLLIRCCTELLPDETPGARMTLVEKVWESLKPHTKFTVDHYNELLRVYKANNRTLSAGIFIKQMAPVTPNITTYELILEVLGEAGDLNQATEVIANMKAQNLPATEAVFNSLIVSHGKNETLKNIAEVLSMMKSVRLDGSINTFTAIARALAWNKKNKQLLDEMEKAHASGMKFEEFHIMEIVKTLAAVSNIQPVPTVLKYLPREILDSPSITPYMQSVTTQLVFQNQPMVALDIYNCLSLPSFGPKDDTGLHGRSLIRDCVKSSVPSSVIALIAQNLMATGRNPIALSNAAEAALQQGKIPLALDLFTRIKQVGLPLRPHYFWPILLTSAKTYGEKGIMNTLSTMVTMDVIPDYETIMQYALPHVSFTSPQNLMKKFLETGLTVSTVLTPMMETLLSTGQIRAASELCELFEGKVDAEKIMKPLIKGYLISMDLKSTFYILQDIQKKALVKNKDWTGRFLCAFLQQGNDNKTLAETMEIAKMLKDFSLKISTPAADFCLSRIPESMKEQKKEEYKTLLFDITDEKVLEDGDIFSTQMPHPKNMNEESLKAHLIELEAKGMNTRGVLRKLLQEYCRSGNLKAAREIVDKCQKEEVFLSAGMKAAIFDLHVKLGEIDMAELILNDLSKTSPNFVLDEYKIIDFATLMAYSGKIDKSFELIAEQSKKRHVTGGKNITMNCWRLLDAVAAHGSAEQTRRMFEKLTSTGYCAPNNVMMGPLIRVHFKGSDLQHAVDEFSRLATKYRKTPLKHELLVKILKAMSDGVSEDNFISNEKINGKLNKMAQSVLATCRKVHGAGDVQLTLIAGLADAGYKKTLRKTLLDPSVKFHPDALLRRCEKFADDGKVDALLAVAECVKGVRHLDPADIYEMILEVYQREDDCDKALNLWYGMQEADIHPTPKFVQIFSGLFKKNKSPVPSEITTLLSKQTKKEDAVDKEKLSNK